MKTRLLIVDDEAPIRFMLTCVLEREGYEIIEARDGREALGLILEKEEKREPIDLLITDLQMPEMTGVELIDELKRREILVPFVVVSGSGKERWENRLREDGGLDFLTKPFDFRDLATRVRRALDITISAGAGGPGADRKRAKPPVEGVFPRFNETL